ncbi:hypothetical protein GYB14_21810 [bacterium]|nr:hypothetical protein [bacterium]
MTRLDQAARLSSASGNATPTVNQTPSITRGDWSRPFGLRHFCDAALTRVKTISFAAYFFQQR